jgi:hypothetical protein
VDGRVQADPARLRLTQQRHCRHCLADRGDRQQRVGGERLAGAGVGDAHRKLLPPAIRADQRDH